MLSNSTGLAQNCGSKVNIWFFKSFSSLMGRAGSPMYPETVHCFSTVGPKLHFSASFLANVAILLGQQ